MRVILNLCLLLTLSSCAAPKPSPPPPPPVCPTVPEAWLAPTPTPAPPTTYGDLRLYTIDVLGQLARCNGDKAAAQERLSK